MQITRTVIDGAIELVVAGRMDGSWSDHLDSALDGVVREGCQDLRLDLSQVDFLSSAGVSVLVRNYQRLTSVGGTFVVLRPSPAVERVLRITRLADPLMAGAPRPARPEVKPQAARRLAPDEAAFDAFDVDAKATLRVEVVGDASDDGPGTASGRDISLGSRSPFLAVGVGAFGGDFADCRDRYGELVSVSGGTAYLPTDGTNAPDYLLSAGALPRDVRLLQGLVCEGRSSTLVRFEPSEPHRTVGLGAILACCRDATGASRAGVVIIAETSGLVGASLRRSPAAEGVREGFFRHPGIRSRLGFTAEPAFARQLVLAAAVVSSPEAAAGVRQLRPIGHGLVGHAHAAVFGFRLLKKGPIDLGATVGALFEEEPIVGVLHLLADDRGTSGAGESQFIRGACWAAPIEGEWIRNA